MTQAYTTEYLPIPSLYFVRNAEGRAVMNFQFKPQAERWIAEQKETTMTTAEYIAQNEAAAVRTHLKLGFRNPLWHKKAGRHLTESEMNDFRRIAKLGMLSDENARHFELR